MKAQGEGGGVRWRYGAVGGVGMRRRPSIAHRVDAHGVAPEFTNDLTGEHIPYRCCLVRATRHERGVVVGNVDVEHLVALAFVLVHKDVFRRVVQLDGVVARAR